jgi:nuclear RNA export factor
VLFNSKLPYLFFITHVEYCLSQDGKVLPPPIGFDLDDSAQLPKATASFICDEAGADIVRQFLHQYFAIYDSDNRQPLLDAYHEQAMLSMTIAYLQPSSNQAR